jgi:hypothetical protein
VDALVTYWYTSPEWRLVHVDEVAVVFVRARRGEPFPYPEVDVGDPDLFPPLDGRDRYHDELSWRARTRFFLDVGRKDLALANWRQALALLPDIEGGDVLLAALERYGSQPGPAPSGEPESAPAAPGGLMRPED